MTASFYPATVGRVSQQQSLTRLLYQVNTDGNAIQDLQTQLSTGRRIQKPSQDPAAAIRALAAQRGQEFKNQVLTNLKASDSILAASESSLAQAQSILNEVRGIAIESAGNTLSDAEREANATQVDTAIDKLVALGNTRFRDQYLFSGSKVDKSPLSFAGNAVGFSGTDVDLQSISDYNSTIAANITAEDAFGVKSSQVVGSVDLNPAVTLATRMSDLNAGDGAKPGAIEVRDGNNVLQIDLSSVHTLQDVVDKVNAQSIGGRALQASLTTVGLKIEFADGQPGQLGIAEVGAGQTAKDLGILTNNILSSSPVVGTDLNPQLTKLTPISSLFGGAGVSNNQTLRIRQNNRDYIISTSGLNTVEDLLNRFERSGARIQASIDGPSGKLKVQSIESGTTLSIGESGGTLASQLGLRTMDVTTPVSQLNFGQGIYTSPTVVDLTITRTDGSALSIDLDGVQTVGDVINRINTNVNNFNPALRVVASLSTSGNGLVLKAPAGAQQISISSSGGSQAAAGLGFVPKGSVSATGSTVGTESVINGGDVSGVEVEGAFTTLIRLSQAIRGGDTESIGRLTNSIDQDITRLSTARAVVGARQQSISELQSRTEDQNTHLKEEESNEIDADLAGVISELSGRQAAYQATLQLVSRASQLSLFNYL
ncbi:MAG: flagellin [Pirellulales bacterium]